MRPETEWILAHRSAHPGVHTASLTIWQAPWVDESISITGFPVGCGFRSGTGPGVADMAGRRPVLVGFGLLDTCPLETLGSRMAEVRGVTGRSGYQDCLDEDTSLVPGGSGNGCRSGCCMYCSRYCNQFLVAGLTGIGSVGPDGSETANLVAGPDAGRSALPPPSLAAGTGPCPESGRNRRLGRFRRNSGPCAGLRADSPGVSVSATSMRWVVRFLFLAIRPRPGFGLGRGLPSAGDPGVAHHFPRRRGVPGLVAPSPSTHPGPQRTAYNLVGLWMAGAVAISLFSIVAWTQGIQVTDVEGVRRARGLFGSPNNLALYLERCVLVALVLLGFADSWKQRLAWGLSAALTASTVLLTFSKGALFLGLPAGGLTILLATIAVRRRWPQARSFIWILAGTVAVGLAALAPFLDTPRMSGVLNWRESFTSLVRIQPLAQCAGHVCGSLVVGSGPRQLSLPIPWIPHRTDGLE